MSDKELIILLAKALFEEKRMSEMWRDLYKELQNNSLPIKKVPEDEPCQTITD